MDQFIKSTCASINDLIDGDIINASGKKEIYGCLFGRDAVKTMLKFMRVVAKNPQLPELEANRLMEVSRKTLLKLVKLQGKEFNIESNEQPGKFLHEYRTENHDRLTKKRSGGTEKPWHNPWYIYADGTLRSYDSVDSTPLTLIAIHEYWKLTGDNKFLDEVLPAVELGLNWIITFGDLDKDLLIEYEFSPQRKHGGLIVQSWTDSGEWLKNADGTMPKYPIAPAEPQGFAWLALKLWADVYADRSQVFAQKLISQAEAIKTRFNEAFIFKDNGKFFVAHALDGDKKMLDIVTGNPMFLLWATYTHPDGRKECIVKETYVDDIVKRSMEDDLFDDRAGIRTMSTKSPTFNPNQDSYHNGSIWPMQNGFAYEALIKWGYMKEASRLRKASLQPLAFFQTPIELFILSKEGKYLEYKSPSGHPGCRVQAWTAASLLDWLTDEVAV